MRTASTTVQRSRSPAGPHSTSDSTRGLGLSLLSAGFSLSSPSASASMPSAKQPSALASATKTVGPAYAMLTSTGTPGRLGLPCPLEPQREHTTSSATACIRFPPPSDTCPRSRAHSRVCSGACSHPFVSGWFSRFGMGCNPSRSAKPIPRFEGGRSEPGTWRSGTRVEGGRSRRGARLASPA
ncbi:hypothetical protein ACFPRL_07065 [Pseudoclavibacter helvolus]